MTLSRVCVFCGSSEGSRPEFRRAAEEMGVALARRGAELVYGGARCGTMGALAQAALGAGGRVVGVIPDFFQERELLHPGLHEVIRTTSLHERKLRMIERASSFVVLPGGFGTLDELFEVLVLAQLGGHAKPVGLLDLDGFYAPLLGWAEGAVGAGFLRPDHLRLVVSAGASEELLERMEAHSMPPMPDLMGASRR